MAPCGSGPWRGGTAPDKMGGPGLMKKKEKERKRKKKKKREREKKGKKEKEKKKNHDHHRHFPLYMHKRFGLMDIILTSWYL